jgi:hypothetical protein
MLRYTIGALFCGVLVSLFTGIIENPPQASIVGARYYGYPLVWRVTMTLHPDEMSFASLAIDALFCIAISFVVLIIVLNVPKYLKTKD